MNFELESTELHALIGENAIWTDALWEAALKFLWSALTEDELIEMAISLSRRERNPDLPADAYLGDFRRIPPQALVLAFDMHRATEVGKVYFATHPR